MPCGAARHEDVRCQPVDVRIGFTASMHGVENRLRKQGVLARRSSAACHEHNLNAALPLRSALAWNKKDWPWTSLALDRE